MSGDPPVCNALHTPTYDAIDCVDWEASETFKTYSGERLDQGQIPIAEIIQRGRSDQVERWREAFERGDPFRDLRQSQVNQSLGYEIQESIEARNAAIARDTQRRADENESLREHYRIAQSSPAIALSELQTICSCYPNPLHRGQHLSAFRTTSERDRFGATVVEPIKFTAIATPNGLKWQYQGAVIID